VAQAAPVATKSTGRPEPAEAGPADEIVPSRDEPRWDQEIAAGDEVSRDEMSKGYEYEKGKFVLFTSAELTALRSEARESIDIVAFIPIGAVDPIYYDKTYLLGPGPRGERSYSLLLRALAQAERSALAKWAWKGKEYVVQIRPAEGGLVLQQLFYADEVRLPNRLGLELVDVGEVELRLALQLIEQGTRAAYDPQEFVDEEKQRILSAVQQKIAGRKTIVHHQDRPAPSADVVDLLDALRASLQPAARKSALPARKPVVRARQKPGDTVVSPRTRKSGGQR
jgi:DNA end-binding protein Ku